MEAVSLRDEIAALRAAYPPEMDFEYTGYRAAITDVLVIIDRHEAENALLCARCDREIRADNPSRNEPQPENDRIIAYWWTCLAHRVAECGDFLASANETTPSCPSCGEIACARIFLDPHQERPARDAMLKAACYTHEAFALRAIVEAIDVLTATVKARSSLNR